MNLNPNSHKLTKVTTTVEFTRAARGSVTYKRLSIAATNGVEVDDLVDALHKVVGFSDAFSEWRANLVKEVSELSLGAQRVETFEFVGECE